MKLSILAMLLISVQSFAAGSYLFTSASCDGRPVKLFEAESDTDVNFKLNFLDQVKVIMTIDAKISNSPMQINLSSRAPLELIPVSQEDNTYKIKADGKASCKIKMNRDVVDCSDDNMITLSEENRVWTIISSGPMKKFITNDYVDEFNECKKYEMFFNKLSM